MGSMLDALLLPRTYYRSLSVNKRTFFYSICAVGIILVGYPFLFENYRSIFVGKSPLNTLFNTVLTIVLIFVLGFSDIMIFCLPVTDLFRYISRKIGGGKDNLLFIKFIKIYTIAALIINPVYIFIMNTIFGDISNTQNVTKIYIYVITAYLIQIWAYGILCRGLCCLLKFKGMQKVMVFIVIFSWSQIWGYVYQYVFHNIIVNFYIK